MPNSDPYVFTHFKPCHPLNSGRNPHSLQVSRVLGPVDRAKPPRTSSARPSSDRVWRLSVLEEVDTRVALRGYNTGIHFAYTYMRAYMYVCMYVCTYIYREVLQEFVPGFFERLYSRLLSGFSLGVWGAFIQHYRRFFEGPCAIT